MEIMPHGITYHLSANALDDECPELDEALKIVAKNISDELDKEILSMLQVESSEPIILKTQTLQFTNMRMGEREKGFYYCPYVPQVQIKNKEE